MTEINKEKTRDILDLVRETNRLIDEEINAAKEKNKIKNKYDKTYLEIEARRFFVQPT